MTDANQELRKLKIKHAGGRKEIREFPSFDMLH